MRNSAAFSVTIKGHPRMGGGWESARQRAYFLLLRLVERFLVLVFFLVPAGLREAARRRRLPPATVAGAAAVGMMLGDSDIRGKKK